MSEGFAQLVKEKQADLGLSQNQFAKRLGVDRSTLSYFYSGRRSPKVAAAVAAHFPDLKDAAILFLLGDVPERIKEEQSARPGPLQRRVQREPITVSKGGFPPGLCELTDRET